MKNDCQGNYAGSYRPRIMDVPDKIEAWEGCDLLFKIKREMPVNRAHVAEAAIKASQPDGADGSETAHQ